MGKEQWESQELHLALLGYLPSAVLASPARCKQSGNFATIASGAAVRRKISVGCLKEGNLSCAARFDHLRSLARIEQIL